MIIAIIVAMIVVSIYLLAIIDLNRREFETQRIKANWLTLIFFLPFIGAVIYLLNKWKFQKKHF